MAKKLVRYGKRGALSCPPLRLSVSACLPACLRACLPASSNSSIRFRYPNSAHQCADCPQNSEWSSESGIEEVCICKTGYYAIDDDTSADRVRSSTPDRDICEPCPEGARCDGEWSLPTNYDGWWGDDSRDSRLYEFYQCQTQAGAVCKENYRCLTGYADR